MNQLLSGGTAIASLAIGVFFLRYWKRSRDRLFLMFAFAFWMYAANRVGLALLDDAHEGRVWLYGLRLCAFLLIVIAIIDKNRNAPQPAAE